MRYNDLIVKLDNMPGPSSNTPIGMKSADGSVECDVIDAELEVINEEVDGESTGNVDYKIWLRTDV